VNFTDSGAKKCTDKIIPQAYISKSTNKKTALIIYFFRMGKIKYGVPQGSILGPLFFLTYINDLPNITADPSKPVLFADDTSIIITNPSPSKFKEGINNIIDNIKDWFRGDTLSLNFDKNYILQI